MFSHASGVGLVLLMVLAGCAADPPDPNRQVPIEAPAAQEVQLLEGVQLTQAVPVPGSLDLAIVHREGRVSLLAGDSRTPVLVLNITDRVSTQGERGLSSLAFHPDFQQNGMLFIAYTKTTDEETRDGFSELTRYRADPDNIEATWQRQDVLLRLEWTQWYHNTADLKFGPDGMLYMGVADGSRERMEAQNLGSLNGSILRMNVDTAPGYTIPADNPFVDRPGARAEIFLYGLRNPWRMDFHPSNGDLYIAASGESKYESVYLFPADASAPRNLGWPYLEGNEQFEEYEPPPMPVLRPIAAYDRPEGSGRCAIVGGTIYEGDLFPTLQGQFVFADHCTGRLMFTQQVQDAWHMTDWEPLEGQYVNSVDTDPDGELVVSTLFGRFYKIVPA